MKTIILYFSYSADAAVLRLSVEQLLAVYPTAQVLVADDAAAPMPEGAMPEGVRVFRTRFNRGGTGKGLEAVRGELATMQEAMAATGADFCLKLDPDVWVRDLDPLLNGTPTGEPEPDFVGCEGARALLPMGCAYRISKWAVAWCLDYLKKRSTWQPGAYAEALTIWHMLALSRLPLSLLPASTGYLAGFHLSTSGRPSVPEDVREAGLVHCGEPHAEAGQAMRATRELGLTRMLLLHACA